jgi:hypothetical protein
MQDVTVVSPRDSILKIVTNWLLLLLLLYFLLIIKNTNFTRLFYIEKEINIMPLVTMEMGLDSALKSAGISSNSKVQT